MEMELGLVWHTGHSDQSAGESNHVWWGRSDRGLVCGRCATKGAEDGLDGRTFAAAGCVGHVCLSHFVFRVGPTRLTWYLHGSIDCPGAHPSAPPPPRAGAGRGGRRSPGRRATFSRLAADVPPYRRVYSARVTKCPDIAAMRLRSRRYTVKPKSMRCKRRPSLRAALLSCRL